MCQRAARCIPRSGGEIVAWGELAEGARCRAKMERRARKKNKKLGRGPRREGKDGGKRS